MRLFNLIGLRPLMSRRKPDKRSENSDPILSANQPHPDKPWKMPKGVCVAASSGHLTSILQDMGVKGVRGKVFRVPEIIWRSPKSVIREFIRGLFESDGTVGDNTYVSMCSKSLGLIQDVQILLMGFGIKAKVASMLNPNYKRLYYLLRLGRQASEIFKNEINFISDKKQAKLENLCKKKHGNTYEEWRWSDTVTKAEVLEADVFDIEVESDHYYLANGFVSHNSCLKAIEGMAAGAAVIASPTLPYASTITHGVNGLLARTEAEWTDALISLIEDDRKRLSIAQAGVQEVHDKWSWENPNCAGIEAWVRMFATIPELR